MRPSKGAQVEKISSVCYFGFFKGVSKSVQVLFNGDNSEIASPGKGRGSIGES